MPDLGASSPAVKAAQSTAFFAALAKAKANYAAGSTNRGCMPQDGSGAPWAPGSNAQNAPLAPVNAAAALALSPYNPPTVLGQAAAGLTPPPCCAPTP